MKRYLLFAGERFYPNGGMYDFRNDFDTLPEAQKGYDSLKAENDFISWGNILDCESGTIYKMVNVHEWVTVVTNN